MLAPAIPDIWVAKFRLFSLFFFVYWDLDYSFHTIHKNCYETQIRNSVTLNLVDKEHIKVLSL